MSANNQIDPMQLSLEQLNSLKTQHEDEIVELSKQLEALYGAKNRFQASRATLDDIATTKPGDAMLVPLTSSLYVPGKILDPNYVSS
jgi:prefoldin alpha subunit